ncbi:MAG: Branched-chain amino acid ABC transporter ATPase [Actinobacteria bacterium]|jgi:branched-chain amino acid transport system ATP-binding protein|nr:Branched-chain amino acid ABC transporter ATPase [Actinomycetota bacterium]
MNALVVRDLHVKINESHILHGVDFDVPSHKVTALLGRNGVGKSTTLKGILGLYPGTGSVQLNGQELIGMPTYKIAQSGVAYVPEDREIFSTLSVRENLALASRSKTNSEAFESIYQLFPELNTRAAQLAGSLSGGQQQMVAIARAMLNTNEILLVDEPTKGLAPKLVTEVADALAKVAEATTMLLVEQNLALVKRIAHHVVVMDQGRVIFQGGPENLDDPSWVHQMLGVSGGHK